MHSYLHKNFILAKSGCYKVTLDTREQTKESGHLDHPSSSKGHDNKQNPDYYVNTVEQPCRHKEYRPRPGEFEGFPDHICIFHPRESRRLEIVTDSMVLQMRFSRCPNQLIMRGSSRIPRVSSPRRTRRSTIFLVALTRMSPRGSKKLTAREVLSVRPTTHEYLRWSEVPITFDRGDHLDFIPKPGRYPLVVYPNVKDVKLNRVLVDGGSSLNLLFLKSFDQMGLSRSLLHPSWAPFHGIVPGIAAVPIGQISLPIIFGTRENFQN
jgi:hypothetical protein